MREQINFPLGIHCKTQSCCPRCCFVKRSLSTTCRQGENELPGNSMQMQHLEKYMGAVRFWHKEWWKPKRILVSNSLRGPGIRKHRNCFLSSKARISYIFIHLPYICTGQCQRNACLISTLLWRSLSEGNH